MENPGSCAVSSVSPHESGITRLTTHPVVEPSPNRTIAVVPSNPVRSVMSPVTSSPSSGSPWAFLRTPATLRSQVPPHETTSSFHLNSSPPHSPMNAGSPSCSRTNPELSSQAEVSHHQRFRAPSRTMDDMVHDSVTSHFNCDRIIIGVHLADGLDERRSLEGLVDRGKDA